MGLLDTLGGIILGAIIDSDSKLGDKTRKTVDYISKEDTARKKRILMDEQIKAHNSGNKELEERIKEERNKYR